MPAISPFSGAVESWDCRTLSLHCPLRAFHWWVGSSVRQNLCPLSIRVAVTLNYRAFSLCCPLWGLCWWVVLAVWLDICPQSPARAAVGLMCVVIFPSPQSRSHFRVVLFTVVLFAGWYSSEAMERLHASGAGWMEWVFSRTQGVWC